MKFSAYARNMAILSLSLVAFVACENVDRQMYDQVSIRTQEFPRKENPKGSVPMFGNRVNYEDVDGSELKAPYKLDSEVAESGRKLYGIYCGVCHGSDGKANTPVADKMGFQPFDLTGADTIELTDGDIFVKIVASYSVMPKHRNELSDREAWEITAYVRKLQDKL